MDLDAVLHRRRMTRRFDRRPIDEAALGRILDTLSHLPSAGFAQGVEALVLTSPERRERFWAAASAPGWRERSPQAPGLVAAPVIVVPVGDPGAYVARYAAVDKASSGLGGVAADAWEVPYWLVDTSFAVLALLLAVEAEGLGALFFRLHRPQAEVLGALGVPEGRVAVGALAVGHRAAGEEPSGSPLRRARRPLEELVHRDGW